MKPSEPRPFLATEDQEAVERIAARLRTDPRTAAAVDRVARHWIDEMKPNAEHQARFDFEYEQAAFCGFMNAANDDPLYPRLHAFARFAHETDGSAIPATKSAHPNPDYIYRFVPIDGESYYLLHGQVPEKGPLVCEYAMLTADQVYQKNVSLTDLQIAPDGSFTISVDPDPADGRPNHFQTNGESFQLLLRDVIGDAATEAPVALRIERVGPSPSRPPRSFEDMLGTVERHIRKHVDDLIFVTRNFVLKNPVNVFAPPRVQSHSMYSVAQAYSPGHYRIADDEALVVSLTLAGAAYATVPVSDLWGGLGDILGHQVNLGTPWSAPNPDGSYTFVLSTRDPGIVNWIDPNGLHEGVMFIRWIGLPPQKEGAESPKLNVRLVSFDTLETAIPSGTPRATELFRRQQLAARRAAYLRVMA
ncbi:hypothetical protein [Flavisphingomonas formosensis]|uniref:hypothetical protein n=1 Tax=Flavisphingomonas formosensis TaxID=861534 RepID=UPI0012F75801|nr:hypothetical protein [Sphingomonas formosensis]